MDEDLTKALRLLERAGRSPFLVCQKSVQNANHRNSDFYVDLRKVLAIEHDVNDVDPSFGRRDSGPPLNLQLLIGAQWTWVRVPTADAPGVIERWQALLLLE
jgi:hypothetical protein